MLSVGAVVEGPFRIKDLKDGELLQFVSSSVEQVTVSKSFLGHGRLIWLTPATNSHYSCKRTSIVHKCAARFLFSIGNILSSLKLHN